MAFQYLKEGHKMEEDRLLSRVSGERTTENGSKLNERRFWLAIRRKFFAVRVVRCWKRLLKEVVEAQPLEAFKARLGRALSNLV